MLCLIKPSGRRYWKDKFHACGWQIGFDQMVKLPDGTEKRVGFSDIGVNRNASIGNALRILNSHVFHTHLKN